MKRILSAAAAFAVALAFSQPSLAQSGAAVVGKGPGVAPFYVFRVTCLTGVNQ